MPIQPVVLTDQLDILRECTSAIPHRCTFLKILFSFKIEVMKRETPQQFLNRQCLQDMRDVVLRVFMDHKMF